MLPVKFDHLPDPGVHGRELLVLAKCAALTGADIAYGRYSALAPTDPRLLEPAGAIAENRLDVAEQLAQTRGYNGFSYADVAAQLGVTKASLHYHFPSKAQLGAALIDRYQTNFGGALRAMEGHADCR